MTKEVHQRVSGGFTSECSVWAFRQGALTRMCAQRPRLPACLPQTSTRLQGLLQCGTFSPLPCYRACTAGSSGKSGLSSSTDPVLPACHPTLIQCSLPATPHWSQHSSCSVAHTCHCHCLHLCKSSFTSQHQCEANGVGQMTTRTQTPSTSKPH